MISLQFNKHLIDRYSTDGFVKKALDESVMFEALSRSVDRPIRSDCCVIFSDISGFSNRVSGLSPIKIKDFLDKYYRYILPIIHQNGGLVDQIIGDGIISVFSKELNRSIADVFQSAFSASMEIVATFSNIADYSTKVALHKDEAIISKVGDPKYQQVTVIGNLMTVVHRVESVAMDRSTNMLDELNESNRVKHRYRNYCFKENLKGIGDKEILAFY